MPIPSGLTVGSIATAAMVIVAAIISLPAFSEQPSTDRHMPDFVPQMLVHEPAESAGSTFAGGASLILEVHGNWTI